ncbi:hypothetical protein HC766_07325, partial [Candidatus Gracilibacteria bacterium]|nr:hypothetical protein [Candidatus Gracilibacteria bacterium]
LRYLLTRRINWLATLGVTFAVWAMILVDSVFTGFVGEIRDDVARGSPAVMLTDLPLDTGYERCAPRSRPTAADGKIRHFSRASCSRPRWRALRSSIRLD